MLHVSAQQPSSKSRERMAVGPADLISSMEVAGKSMTLDGLGINAPGILNASIIEDGDRPEYGKLLTIYISYYFVTAFN